MTRAVERLSIDWPAEREDVHSKSRLDERFSPSRVCELRRATDLSLMAIAAPGGQ